MAVVRAILFLFLMAGWQVSATYWIGTKWISAPTLLAETFVARIGDGTLIRHSLVTVEEALLGLVFGTIVGLVVGLALARAPRLFVKAVDPFILAAYSVPRIALAPFFILWFGIGLSSKVILVVSVVAFVVMFNIRQGIETIDPDLVDAMRTMRASRFQMMRNVTIPAVVSWLVAATKISVGMAVVSAVVGEVIASTEGLGWYMTQTINQFNMTGAMASLLTMAALAMILYAFVGAIERRVLHWQPTAGGMARTVQL